MANLNDSMTITSTALTHASKDLINQREFDSTSVITVGNPTLLNGVASSFSASSYYKKEELNFSGASRVEVSLDGIYLSSVTDQVLFTLWDQSEQFLRTEASSTNIKVFMGDLMIIELPVTLNHEDSINFKFQLTTDTVDLLVFVNTDVYQASATGSFADIIKDGYTLYIGSDPIKTSAYWEGSIDLKDLMVKIDGSVYFSTGILRGYTFTKLLVSDGTIELTDSSYEVLNHVVECPVEEITRTNNNILLKATLGEDSAVSIQEVGLYCYDGVKTILFSKISDLGIKKNSDLEYSLILHINLDMNVVNTSFFPEIVINEEESVNSSDFEKVRRDYIYMTSNLERMIKGNSLGLGNYKDFEDLVGIEEGSTTKQTYTKLNPLDTEGIPNRTMVDAKPSGVGYNKPQINYKKQKNENALREAYNAILDYSKVQEKFQLITKTTFTDESLTKVGSAIINEEGEASIFSEVDYVKSSSSLTNNSSFDITIAFEADSTLANVGTICCFTNNSKVQPLTLRLNQDMIHITIGQEEAVVVAVDGKNELYTRGTEVAINSGTTYYSWSYDGLNTNLPSTLYTTVISPVTTSKLYTTEFTEYTGAVKSYTSGVVIDEDIVKATLGTKQYIRVTFDGNVYKVYVKNGDKDYSLFSSKVTPVKMGATKEILFGIGYANSDYSNPFYGTIFLAEFDFIGSNNKVNFLEESVVQDVIIQDYYHIPIEAKSYYDTPNLNHSSDDYSINIQEGLLQGRKDSITFDNKKGFSLSIKSKLEDSDSKVVLSKVIPSSGLSYFTFELKDSTIFFNLYAKDSTLVLKKELPILNFRRYLSYWSLFSVTYQIVTSNMAICNFYMNKELLDTATVVPLTFDTGNYKLANYIEKTSEADKNYVSDILFFDGTLSEEDLFYLCNILDTNF